MLAYLNSLCCDIEHTGDFKMASKILLNSTPLYLGMFDDELFDIHIKFLSNFNLIYEKSKILTLLPTMDMILGRKTKKNLEIY